VPTGPEWKPTFFLVLVTIQGRVPFRRHHTSRRARLRSRARGSISCHTRSLRRIRRGNNDCGWCGRGGCWRCRLGTCGQAGGVPKTTALALSHAGQTQFLFFSAVELCINNNTFSVMRHEIVRVKCCARVISQPH